MSSPEDEPPLEALRRERDLYRQLLDLSSLHDVPSFLEEALRVATESARAAKGYLAVFHGDPRDPDTPRHALGRGVTATEQAVIEGQISRGIVAEALEKGELIQTVSAMDDARFQERRSVRDLQIEAVLAAPVGKPACGVLYLQGAARRRFSEVDVEMLTRVATHLGGLVMGLLRQLERDQGDPTSRYREGGHFARLAGRSRPFADVLAKASRYARIESTVLITGQTGTGKTELAREIHAMSARRDGPCVELNCAAIPGALFESELFGAADGAFTDRRGGVVGNIESANGGTLILDEVGDVPLDQQPKLLQLIQDRTYRRLGDSQPHPADIRIIASTNRDLAAMVRDGAFRPDLFHRLDVLRIRMPPLHERRGDLPDIATALGRRIAEEMGVPWPGITTAGMLILEQHSYDGGARELANLIHRALANHPGPLDDRALLDLPPTEDGGGLLPMAEAVDRFRRSYAEQAVRLSGNDKAETARRLAIARSTLYRLLDDANPPDDLPTDDDA